jgi:hypothetical protein
MKTDYEILYDYYVDICTKARNRVIEYLKVGDIKGLLKAKDGVFMMYTYKRKTVTIDEGNIDYVIKQLTKIKSGRKLNETEIQVESCTKWDSDYDNEVHCALCCESRLYSVESEDRITALAKCYADQAMWKIKHQTEGKDTQASIRLIKRLKNEVH